MPTKLFQIATIIAGCAIAIAVGAPEFALAGGGAAICAELIRKLTK